VKLPANAKTVILKKSGHLGFVEEEDKSVKVIIKFVENLKDFWKRQKTKVTRPKEKQEES
jgi:hypothetical protein